MTDTWMCIRCAARDRDVTVGDLLRAWETCEPDDPDVRCSLCDLPPPEPTRLRLVMERLALLASAPVSVQPTAPVQPAAPAPTATPKRRRNSGAALLSKRAAARRIGIARATLAQLEDAQLIVSVPKGRRRGYRAADVERLVEQGFTLPEAPPKPPPPKRKRRRSSNGTAAADVAAKLAEF